MTVCGLLITQNCVYLTMSSVSNALYTSRAYRLYTVIQLLEYCMYSNTLLVSIFYCQSLSWKINVQTTTVEIGTKVWKMKIHGTGEYSDFVESFYLINGENFTFSLLLMMKGGLQIYCCSWNGRESWHALIKLSTQLPFLILKVSYPAIS